MHWCILLPLLFVFAEAGQCPPGYSLCSAANKCYRVYEEHVTIMNAQYTCTQGGGDLATIPNAAANDFVLSLIGTFPWYRIGASNIAVYYEGYQSFTNSTKWIDGTPFNYSNFGLDQPTTNDCFWMNRYSGQNGPCDAWIPFVCSANPIYNTSTIIQSKFCPSRWTFYDKTSSCYRSFVNENFDQAQLTCSSLGANLTSVTSGEENAFLKLAQTGLGLNPNQQVWIGIRRQGTQWYNIDGSPYTYSNFGQLYPRTVDGDNNCAILFADRWSSNPSFVGYWQDYSCSFPQRAYICKMPATSG